MDDDDDDDDDDDVRSPIRFRPSVDVKGDIGTEKSPELEPHGWKAATKGSIVV